MSRALVRVDARRLPGLVLLSLLASALAGFPLHAQSKPSTIADSVGLVVQAFYTWYVPQAHAANGSPAWMSAVRLRREIFAPRLVEGLRRDSVASARSRDEIVGLDGDPFLNAQDPCKRYVVRRVRPRDERFLVEVVGVGGCAGHIRPDVIVEVARHGSTFRFENFRYLDPPDDLLGLLGRLQKR